MKKLLMIVSVLVGTSSLFAQSRKRLVTLRNCTSQDRTFWVQYGPGSACKSGAVHLATSGRRQTVRLYSGGDCPLVSINPGNELKTDHPIAHIRDKAQNETPEWQGKGEINFYPKGFFPTQRRLIKLEAKGDDHHGGRRWRRRSAVLDVIYDKGSECVSKRMPLPYNSVRIYSGGDCPIKSIKATVGEQLVDWANRERGPIQYNSIEIDINRARDNTLFF